MKLGRPANRKFPSAPPRDRVTAGSGTARQRIATGRSATAIALDVLAVLAALLAVAGFFVGGRALSQWLRTSEIFSVASVEVRGTERLGRAEILEIAGIRMGESMFSIDEAAAERTLEAHPWIREATIRKRMPGAVHVEIVERDLAVLLWRGALYRVDSDGTVFERHPDGAPIDRVVITGMDESWAEGDRERIETELRKIIQVLGEYERMGLASLAPPSSVHREHGGGIVLYVGDDAREVRLGVGHTRKKLMRLRAVLEEIARDGFEWEYIMVDSRNFPERVVVKLRES